MGDYIDALPECFPRELKRIILKYALPEELNNLLCIFEDEKFKTKEYKKSMARFFFCAVFGFDVRDVNEWVDSYYKQNDFTLEDLYQKCINKLMRIEK